MSRYRDDDFYGGRGRARRGGGGDDAPDSPRGDYQTGGFRRDEDDYYPRRERDDYARGGGAIRRDGLAPRRDEDDDSRRGGRDDYARPGDERERSFFDDARDYLRRPFDDDRRDRGEGRGGRRGASRSHVRCRDIMTRDVTAATRDTTLVDVARMMRDEDTGVIPVVDRVDAPVLTTEGGADSAGDAPRINDRVRSNGKLVGLITDRDISVRAVADGKDTRATRAEEIMTSDVHTAQPNDRVIDAIRKMGDKQVRRIPIVDRDGLLRGIISMADVALETEEDRELADALEEISSGSSFWNRVFG